MESLSELVAKRKSSRESICSKSPFLFSWFPESREGKCECSLSWSPPLKNGSFHDRLFFPWSVFSVDHKKKKNHFQSFDKVTFLSWNISSIFSQPIEKISMKDSLIIHFREHVFSRIFCWIAFFQFQEFKKSQACTEPLMLDFK